MICDYDYDYCGCYLFVCLLFVLSSLFQHSSCSFVCAMLAVNVLNEKSGCIGEQGGVKCYEPIVSHCCFVVIA